MARKYIIVDDVTEKQAGDKEAFFENFRLAANGQTRYVDITEATRDGIMSGTIALADAMAKGRPAPVPEFARWGDIKDPAQQAWHYEVKAWCQAINGETGNFNVAGKIPPNTNMPNTLAGPAPEWMQGVFLEAFPDRTMPPVPPKGK